ALERAEEQRAQAEASRRGEAAARRELARVSYRHRIHLAHQAWSDGHVGQALKLLDDCPAELRGWEHGYLRRLCEGELLALPGEQGCTGHGLAFDPTGRLLAVAGGYRQTASLFDPLTGRVRHVLARREGRVRGVAFSPDGQAL